MKKILITGGGYGIGLESAKQFLTESGRYKISAVVTEQGYQLKAQAQQAQTEDKSCQVFLLNNYGQKRSEPGSVCWTY